ncbi:DUF397 domain-containing protein [Streptomyces mirabilis]|uniref:DUF397 domain-containing protein n=1 Tax=Streptomyces mirabilis TaxID=68239 RepID=UPI0036AEB8F2
MTLVSRRRGGPLSGGGELVLKTVGRQAATVHVRDSKDTRRAQLAFTGVSWTEFVSSVRR